MMTDTLSRWLSMGGYGFYVWSAYGALVLAIAAELFLLRARRRAAIDRAQALDDAFADSRPPDDGPKGSS
ncbi:MAG: heme exporter protein CcmD [Burkholderiaceae bacterium]|nr:heme exporter protein CcmD [Burkholderiaceae bacterium]